MGTQRTRVPGFGPPSSPRVSVLALNKMAGATRGREGGAKGGGRGGVVRGVPSLIENTFT